MGAKAKVAAAGLSAALMLTATWEGLSLVTYRDVVGVLTYCYGETQGAVEGRRHTKAECEERLAARILEFDAGVTRCLGFQPPHAPRTAFVSFSYNVGLSAFCSSTMARFARLGEWVAACAEFPKWRWAGGSIWQGLINRRADERAWCEGRKA